MPTGYTQSVYDGRVTDLKTFANFCLGAFVVQLQDRAFDAPMPLKVETEAYYTESTVKDRKTDTQVADECAAEYLSALARYHKACSERDRGLRDYIKMLDQVLRWKAPESCRALKEFMITQLYDSMRELSHTLETPKLQTVEQVRDHDAWYENDRAKARSKAEQRTAETNKLLADLRESFYVE